MTFARSETFRSIGQIPAADVLPALYRSQKLPLRISCLGVASYVASYDASDAANSFDRVIPLGECPSPEEAIQAAAATRSRSSVSLPSYQPSIRTPKMRRITVSITVLMTAQRSALHGNAPAKRLANTLCFRRCASLFLACSSGIAPTGFWSVHESQSRPSYTPMPV